MSVTTDPRKTGIVIGATTYTQATLPSASVAGAQSLAWVTDLGENGSLMQSTGTRWRALNGAAALKTLGAAVTGIANTETIVLQALLPAGSWQVNDTIRVWVAINKSGTTDTLIGVCRIGTAGTTADTAVLGGITLLSAANQSGGFIFDFKLASATSAQVVGSTGAIPAYFGGVNAASSAAVVISDTSVNPVYVSASIRSSSTTNTVGIQSGQIQLVTP